MRIRPRLVVVLLLANGTAGALEAQITSNPIPAPIVKRGIFVEVKDVVRLPDTRGVRPPDQDVSPAGWARLSYVRDLPDGRRFANDSRGFLYRLDDKNQPIAGMDFAGGTPIDIRGKAHVNTANLTPSPNGIPYYTEELFLETLRTGRVHARQLSDVMPWRFFRNMTDEDLKALFAYLKTAKPVEHYVDNAVPPTPCPRCGHEHGGGDRNKKAS